jgi:hypothetical protein
MTIRGQWIMGKFKNIASGIFLFWNATPTKRGLARDLKNIADAGFSCVYLHPMPDSFRKHNFFKGMECSYLGKQYFDLAKVMLEECRRLGLVMMLYDEGGWPSGGVLDRLVKMHPECRARYLMKKDSGELETVFEEVPDLLDPRTTKVFIDMVYEKYREAFGDEFGKTIKGIFTDEPFFRCYIGARKVRIADGMEKRVREKFNCDLVKDLLPFLWEGTENLPGAQEARRKYLQVCSEMFADNYSKVLEKWCRKNHLDLEGHFNREDEYFEVGDCGDLLEVLAPLHVPGVDAIWRQVYPGNGMAHFVRFAASAAIRSGRRETLCECFNVYGYGLTLPVMHWVANTLLIQGITRILPMPYLYGDMKLRKICCSTDISHRNPQWEAMKALTDFWNIAGQFDAGANEPDVWVLARTEYPAPDVLSPIPEKQKQAGMRVNALLDRLEHEVIPWRFANYNDLFGQHLPKILVLPSAPDKWETEAFPRLREAGVQIITGWDDCLKKHACVSLVDKRNVCRVLPCVRPEGESLMVFNPSDETVTFRFRTSKAWTELPADRVLAELHPIVCSDGILSLVLPPGALRILLKDKETAQETPPAFTKQPLHLQWTVTKEERLSLTAEKPTRFRSITPNIPLPADGLYKEKDFSGKLTLEAELDAPESVSGYLVFDRVCHAGELFVNGRKSGLRAFAPWAFPIKLRKGKNTLKLRVFSSAGNEWRRCLREELEPRGWFNVYAHRLKEYLVDDAETGIPGSIALFCRKD